MSNMNAIKLLGASASLLASTCIFAGSSFEATLADVSVQALIEHAGVGRI